MQDCGSAFIFCGCESSIFSQCGSWSSCFLNADPDLAKINFVKITILRVFYTKKKQIARKLETGLEIRSFAHRTFAHLLISLKSNERLWAIRSDRSREMSDRERIPQVAQRKWATVSESLRSHKTNERPWAICSGCSEEMSQWVINSTTFGLKNLKSFFKTFLVCFLYNFFF